MENLFIGFRTNGQLYGAKSYIGNEKEWSKAHEMIIGFYNRNNLSDMKELFGLISWESIGNNKRINNGFTFMALLKEDTIERYALYRKAVDMKISKKMAKKTPLYDPSYFEEKEGEIVASFKNYGEIFSEFHFEKAYILDLDKDVLVIEDKKEGVKQELMRECFYMSLRK
jgi:hypothetical protein